MIAQIDEQHAAMVALAVNPARQADGRADIGGAELGAGVGAIGVHGLLLACVMDEGGNERRASPFTRRFVNPRAAGYGPRNMKIHPLITTVRRTCRPRRPAVRRNRSSPSTPSSCARTPIWPELCLIQIASTEEAAAIDPKADGIDLKPLLDLLVENHDVLKVFHAGGQDLEIIHNLTGKMPAPLFDTQIAAMALGYGEQIGYSNLIESHARPQPRQGRALHRLEPPAARQAADRLCDRRRHPFGDDLPADGREVEEERPRRAGSTRRWSGSPTRRASRSTPEDAWKRLKLPSRNPAVLGRLKALAGVARDRGARRRICRAAGSSRTTRCGELASHPPKTQEDLGQGARPVGGLAEQRHRRAG